MEVKAEEKVKAKSLNAYFNKYNSPYAVRTSMMDYRKEEWMVNIPLYAISSL